MNVYLLKGKEYMIIEGGMSYIVPDLLRQFRERSIDISKITRLSLVLHSHFDHCGIAPFFQRKIPGLRIVGSGRSQELYRKGKGHQLHPGTEPGDDSAPEYGKERLTSWAWISTGWPLMRRWEKGIPLTWGKV